MQQAAAAVLLQLVNGLKHSLALAHHPELARSEYGDSIAAAAAAAAAGVPGAAAAAAGSPAPDPDCSAGPPFVGSSSLLAAAKLVPGFSAAAHALAAANTPVLDPSCPNSYPQLPLPDDSGAGADGAWGLAGAAGGMWEQQRVDVTAAATSICLQVNQAGTAGSGWSLGGAVGQTVTKLPECYLWHCATVGQLHVKAADSAALFWPVASVCMYELCGHCWHLFHVCKVM